MDGHAAGTVFGFLSVLIKERLGFFLREGLSRPMPSLAHI
jgi:hypothetical protein